MASKDKDTSPKSQTTTSAMEENVVPQPSQNGLASITASAITEAGKSTDVVQKAQVSPDATKRKFTRVYLYWGVSGQCWSFSSLLWEEDETWGWPQPQAGDGGLLLGH